MVKTKLWQGITVSVLALTLTCTAGVVSATAATPAASSTTAPSAAAQALTQSVYQAVNPKSNASLVTAYSDEVANAQTKYGFTESKGTLFKASTKPASGLTPVYRLFKNGDFMWVPKTASAGEYESATTKYGYTSQQIDYYVSTSQVAGTVPVYRFLKGSMHRLVVDSAEMDKLKAAGWTNEGAKFYAASPAAAVTPPTSTSPALGTPTPNNPSTAPVPAAAANWVTWESIAKPGDNIQTVLNNPALTGKVLKLPAGVFEVSNFQNPNVAINIPSRVKGVVGQGSDTIIRIKANTSTYASTVPKQGTGQTNQLYIIRMNDGFGTGPQTLSNLWVQGTEQGHLYNGIMVGKADVGTSVKNLLITGVPGDAGSPPGETFGLNFWRTNQSVIQNIEVDGYRWTGDSYKTRVKGEKVGSSPIGYNDANNNKLYDAYTHDSKTGMPTYWQSNDNESWNLQSINNNAGINHEESFGTVHHQPVIYGVGNLHHIMFNSGRADGKLTIIGATVDGWTGTVKPGPIGKGQKMLVLTGQNYIGPNTNKIVTKPVIVLDDGVTPQPFTWAH